METSLEKVRADLSYQKDNTSEKEKKWSQDKGRMEVEIAQLENTVYNHRQIKDGELNGLKQSHEAEIAQIQSRVKGAIGNKDKIISGCKEDVKRKDDEITKLKQIIEDQRKQV